MSLCSRHRYSEKNDLFASEKLDIGLFQSVELVFIRFISISSHGPTPPERTRPSELGLQLARPLSSLGISSKNNKKNRPAIKPETQMNTLDNPAEEPQVDGVFRGGYSQNSEEG